MTDLRNGRWLVRECCRHPRSPFWITDFIDTRTGKRYQKSTKQKTKKGARAAVTELIEEIEKKEHARIIDDERTRGGTFAEAAAEFLGLKAASPETIALYRADFDKRYIPHFGKDTLLSEITRADVEEFVLVGYKAASHRTRRKHLVALRSLFSWAVGHDKIVKNPAEGIKITDRLKVPVKRVLTLAEARKLLKACAEDVVVEMKPKKKPGGNRRKNPWKQTIRPPEHLAIAVLIAMHTGLRRKNVLGLRWEQIDFEEGVIEISAEEMKASRGHVAPIHRELLGVLKARAREGGRVPKGPVLGEIQESKKALRTACKRAKIPDTTWSTSIDGKPTLRASWATWLAPLCSYPALKTLLGHAAGNDVTLQYQAPPIDELRAAIESLPCLLGDTAAKVGVDGAGFVG